ncbi:arginase family protein [Labrys monachus]|uniref:Agmatinase n=1 Tax=Labrys monachus TaxID=217067 RepID=A0ABU0FN80_9HYPH|nr:arginase family protein [Labrys monachus]MDQ0396070.1 agmatinase [Labrys monachus]
MPPSPAFLGFPDRLPGNVAPRAVLFGAPHGTLYPGIDAAPFAQAPAAIRAASQEDADWTEHWDFDLDGPLFAGGPAACVDIGDVPTTLGDGAGNRALIERQTRAILAASAVPVMIGGDDSVPIPFLAGFAPAGPIWILQVDAHIDWREERYGERFGFSSTMRRASEMPHVAGIVQVGLRGLGSARAAEIEAAKSYGARFVTARELHRDGPEAALRHIPAGANVVVTFDCDALDPAVMPAVAAPTPGGLDYGQAIGLIEGVAARARIAGFDLIEFFPPSDRGGVSAITAARLLVNVIGRIARQA